MSNEIAVVRFRNGEVFYTAYHGTSSAVNYPLKSSENEVIEDPFSDPDYDQWEADAQPGDMADDFYKRQALITYPDEEVVEIYTPYASGLWWIGKASRSELRVTGGFSDDDDPNYRSGIVPEWAKGLIKSRLLKP